MKRFGCNAVLLAALVACIVANGVRVAGTPQRESPERQREIAAAQAVVARNKEKVGLNPNDAQAHKALGDAYLILEDYKNAYDSYREVIRVTPGDAEAYRGIGGALEGGRQYARARDAYKEAVRLNPVYARAQTDLGKTLVALFQYREAVGPLTEGIRLTPRGKVEHRDYFSLGEAYLHTGQYQDALRAYQQALEVAPRYSSTHAGIAEAYNGLKQYDKAVASAGLALKDSPNSHKANRVLGDSYAGMERFDTAVEYYKESIRVSSSNRYQVEALLGLGLTYMRMGRHEEAAAALEKGVQYASTPKQFSVEDEIEPGLLPAHYFGLAQANLNLGRGQAAADASRKYIEIRSWADSNAPYAALMWYFGSRQAGGADEARKVLEEISGRMDAKAWPHPVFQYLRGESQADLLLASANDNDKMTEARAYLGMSLNLAGRADEARPHLEWVVKNGNRNFIEYTLAQSELLRVARGSGATLLAPGNPPLTREVSDSVAEMVAFLLTEWGKPFVADQQFKDEWAKMLAARYVNRTPAEQERLSRVPEIWAFLRTSWPQMKEEERARYRAEWREAFKQGLDASLTKEQAEAEKSLQALQALIRTGQQRPLQPPELSTAAGHMDVVATGLRQLGGEQNEAMAAQMTQTAQQFRAAAQQGRAVSPLPNALENPSANQATDRPDPNGAVRMVQRMNSNHFSTMSMIQFMSRRF